MAGGSLFALAGQSLLSTVGAQGNRSRQPNVVFILADDLGWCDTTLFGTTRLYETPNLERLAKRGMVFSNAYSANPLCSPTRASILTGLYPGRLGLTQAAGHLPTVKTKATVAQKAQPWFKVVMPESATRLDTAYGTLAEAFKEAGYVTGHFGKWHLGPEPYSPLEQGFDVDVPHTPGAGPGRTYVAPWSVSGQPKFQGKDGDHIEDRMADEAMAFLEQNRDKPFFLNYWAFSVHAPFDAKKETVEKYRPKIKAEDPQKSPVYAAMVQSFDENVGRLLDKLDALKLSDQTILVFTSDNGGNDYERVEGVPPTSNAPLRGGKATIYEGGSKVPAIVVWPGRVKPGSRSEGLLSSVDWYPTLLAMCGRKPAPTAGLDGINQVPVLLGAAAARESLVCYFPHYIPKTGSLPAVSVRRGSMKLIRFYGDGPDLKDRFELYDLVKDPGEMDNLADRRPDLVGDLNRLIDAFHRDTGALVPVKNPAYDASAQPPAPKKAGEGAGAKPEGKDPRLERERKSDEM